MERKNKELVKKNLELLEEVNNLNSLHTDILKEDIKRKYNGTRSYNKLLQTVDDNINITQALLKSSIKMKEDLLFLNSFFNEDKESLKKKSEIINVLDENKNMIDGIINPINGLKQKKEDSFTSKDKLDCGSKDTNLEIREKKNSKPETQEKVLKEINKNIVKEPKRRKNIVKKFKK